MGKPFDVSKYRKDITKSIDGLSIGFHDPTDWVSTGNYALNYLISGDFYKGVPMGKVTVFAGESGAGKSYFASANIVKNAQEQGIFVVLIDSENALDETWLHALGVDTDERVRASKGDSRPFNTIEDRVAMLQSIKYIDEIRVFDHDDELDTQVLLSRAEIMVVGSDYKDKKVIGSRHVQKVKFFDRIDGYSTTRILVGLQ